MEKEKYQELSPEEVKKFEEENMTDEEREMSERRVKDVLNKTQARVLSDAELIQKGSKYVLDDGLDSLRLEVSKKALQNVKKEMSENLSPKDKPRILEMIKKLGIRGNRWISDQEYIKREKVHDIWASLYEGDKYYINGDIIKIKRKDGRVFKGRFIEEEDAKVYDINDHSVEAQYLDYKTTVLG